MAFVLAGLAALLAGLYVAGWYFTGDRVPHGTTVAGVEIGGLAAGEARERLQDELGPRATHSIALAHHNEVYEIEPATAGLGLDLATTVSDAGAGRSWNPVRMVEILIGDDNEVEPSIDVDEEALAMAVGDVAARLDREPQEPSVSFSASGEPRVQAPVTGVDVDADATADAVVAAYLSRNTSVAIEVDEVLPEVDADGVAQALAELGSTAVLEPIMLDTPGGQVALKVRDYARSLNLVVEGGALKPKIDDRVLGLHLTDLLARVGVEPADARIVIDRGAPVVVPATPGVTISAEAVADAILPVLSATGAARVAEVGQTTARPDFTTAEAKALGVQEVVGEFVTYFPYAEYRNINQGRAAELLDGTLLKPGELFSFNDTVGERTKENGFVKGFVISDGVFAEELGGGVSQVVTTTYNAAFFAGLEDVEHQPHSFYIDRYPMGREATVAWPTVDLKFRNTTPHGVLVEAWVVPSTVSSQGEMHVRMWSTDYWDIRAGLSEQYAFTSPSTRYGSTDDCVPTTGYGGFSVDVTRILRRVGSDEVVKREVDEVVYTPADTVIC